MGGRNGNDDVPSPRRADSEVITMTDNARAPLSKRTVMMVVAALVVLIGIIATVGFVRVVSSVDSSIDDNSTSQASKSATALGRQHDGSADITPIKRRNRNRPAHLHFHRLPVRRQD